MGSYEIFRKNCQSWREIATVEAAQGSSSACSDTCVMHTMSRPVVLSLQAEGAHKQWNHLTGAISGVLRPYHPFCIGDMLTLPFSSILSFSDDNSNYRTYQ